MAELYEHVEQPTSPFHPSHPGYVGATMVLAIVIVIGLVVWDEAGRRDARRRRRCTRHSAGSGGNA